MKKTLQELKDYNEKTYRCFKAHVHLSFCFGNEVAGTGIKRFFDACEVKGVDQVGRSDVFRSFWT